MNRRKSFKRQTWLLFFIVTLTPALTVSALWYFFSIGTGSVIVEVGRYVVPLALLGLAPAIAVSVILAKLLVIPMRHIHDGIREIAGGNLAFRLRVSRGGEFADIAQGINDIASSLDQFIAQARGETDVIAAERAKLSTVLDALNDGVVALDGSGDILLYNRGAADITGIALAQAGGQPITRILPLTKNGLAVLEQWLSEPATERTHTTNWHKLELMRPDGQTRYIDAHAMRIIGDPTGVKALITLHDETKNVELEEMKVDFVALAAHELRTPLTSIKGYLDILQVEASEQLSRSQRAFLKHCIVGANQLLGLMNNLLNVARIEHGEINYSAELVDWHIFLTKLADDFKDMAGAEERVFSLLIPKALPRVTIDRFALIQVLTNLVANAIRHTKPGDVIEIKARLTDHGKEIETTVRDSGTGIPAEALPKLFAKFYRVEGLRSGGGTGLGLYIAKSIVEAHRGYIWAESKLGQGATFGFNLPVATVAPGRKATHNGNGNEKLIHGTHGWIRDVKKNPNS